MFLRHFLAQCVWARCPLGELLLEVLVQQLDHVLLLIFVDSERFDAILNQLFELSISARCFADQHRPHPLPFHFFASGFQ